MEDEILCEGVEKPQNPGIFLFPFSRFPFPIFHRGHRGHRDTAIITC